jgi:type I restriction enzyme R subunit
MSGEAVDLFARFVGAEGLGSFAANLSDRLRSDFTTTMHILRDDDFLSLLENYPRPQRVFLVAPGVEDVVVSERLIRGGAGKEYKPEDYLAAFDAFINEHQDDIDAISVLLSNPGAWGTEPLAELRNELRRAPEHFTEDNLQPAFQLTKQKAMVDIISMVKHSASKESPLLTAAERVSLAVERLTNELELSDEQKTWLGYIRASLVENLAVGPDDFDLIPVLADRGGWRRADRVFEGRLTHLLDRLNSALVEAA